MRHDFNAIRLVFRLNRVELGTYFYILLLASEKLHCENLLYGYAGWFVMGEFQG